MLRLQGTKRIQAISGRTKRGEVEVIKDLVCARKHMIDNAGWSRVRSAHNLFAFVSSPHIYKQKEMLQRVRAWCHPFKDPAKNLPSKVPSILLPESDFLDSTIVFCNNERNIKYDYFYFTVNSLAGIENKGFYTFVDILPALCKYNLKGLIVVYYPNCGTPKRFRFSLSKQQRKCLDHYNKYLSYHWGLLDDRKMDASMTQCKFGLFPNTVDNSPRIISESLSRNVPILVNDEIHGGWHYITQETGSLFNKKNIDEKIDFMLSNKFDARDTYESLFGFEKSSDKLARFLNPIFNYDYTHICFKAFEKALRRIK